jgi:hypothetical protein
VCSGSDLRSGSYGISCIRDSSRTPSLGSQSACPPDVRRALRGLLQRAPAVLIGALRVIARMQEIPRYDAICSLLRDRACHCDTRGPLVVEVDPRSASRGRWESERTAPVSRAADRDNRQQNQANGGVSPGASASSWLFQLRRVHLPAHRSPGRRKGSSPSHAQGM